MKSKYAVNGNEKLDQLFYMIDNCHVLSTELSAELRGTAFWILTVNKDNIDGFLERINNVINNLRYCLIFSDKFINDLEKLYAEACNFEFNRD